MADPIKASIEVEIDPPNENGRYRMTWPNGNTSYFNAEKAPSPPPSRPARSPDPVY